MFVCALSPGQIKQLSVIPRRVGGDGQPGSGIDVHVMLAHVQSRFNLPNYLIVFICTLVFDDD